MRRGEIRWYTYRLPDGRRPVLLLTRDEVVDALNEIIVVPVTRTIRELASDVVLDERDGMPTTCALNFDHTALAQRSRIGSKLCDFPTSRWPEAQHALLTACGFEVSSRHGMHDV